MSLPTKTCRCCEKEQVGNGKKARTLIVLPTWTAGNNKRKRKYPVYACDYCDGPVVANALARKAA